VRITVPTLLLALAATVAAIDCIWASGPFFPGYGAYLRAGADVGGLLAGAAFIATLRTKSEPSAMLFSADFYAAFSRAPACSIISAHVVGKPIDPMLVQADHMLGFDWYKVLVGNGGYPI